MTNPVTAEWVASTVKFGDVTTGLMAAAVAVIGFVLVKKGVAIVIRMVRGG